MLPHMYMYMYTHVQQFVFNVLQVMFVREYIV